MAVLSVRVTGTRRGGQRQDRGRQDRDRRRSERRRSSSQGVIRPDDVGSDNTVASSRVADAVISYKGKKIGPRQGILGKILSILWP